MVQTERGPARDRWTVTPRELAGRPGPTYQAIAGLITDAIRDSRLRPGERLPPQRELAWQLKVTVGTIGRAYELVTQRGLVRGEVGRGTFVAPPVPTLPSPLIHEEAPVRSVLDLGSNVPTPTAPQAELRDLLAACAVAPELPERLASYPPALGLPQHRAAGAAWLRQRGVPAEPGQVLVTGGTQGALTAVLSMLAPPGSTVLCESLTYNGIRTLARRLSFRLEPVALDEEGVRPDALEAAVKGSGARVLVLCPTIHNPTAATMGEGRRQTLAALARRFDIVLVEDDVYGAPPPGTTATLGGPGARTDGASHRRLEVPGTRSPRRLRAGAGSARGTGGRRLGPARSRQPRRFWPKSSRAPSSRAWPIARCVPNARKRPSARRSAAVYLAGHPFSRGRNGASRLAPTAGRVDERRVHHGARDRRRASFPGRALPHRTGCCPTFGTAVHLRAANARGTRRGAEADRGPPALRFRRT